MPYAPAAPKRVRKRILGAEMDEQTTNDERTASEQVRAVLEDEYRANPLLIRQRTNLPKQRVYRVLNRLCVSGDVSKVCKGLYESTEELRDGE